QPDPGSRRLFHPPMAIRAAAGTVCAGRSGNGRRRCAPHRPDRGRNRPAARRVGPGAPAIRRGHPACRHALPESGRPAPRRYRRPDRRPAGRRRPPTALENHAPDTRPGDSRSRCPVVHAACPGCRRGHSHHRYIGVRLAAGDRRPPSKIMRRILDLAIAVPVALLFTPLVLVAGVAIHIIDPGPVFFWQPREGLAGKTARILKLRTMYRDAERRLETLLANDPAIQAEWSTHFKLKHDPRILPVIGHLLRSTSLDELPQLFNVIVGEMGIVGPRPFPEYHLLAMNA